MSHYLKPLTKAFESFPVGSFVTGLDRRGDLQRGYVAPTGFGVITDPQVVNFGRAWVTVVRDAPVGDAFNLDRKFTWKVWTDTLVAADEFSAESEPRAVVAHLLVEVTFRPARLTRPRRCASRTPWSTRR